MTRSNSPPRRGLRPKAVADERRPGCRSRLLLAALVGGLASPSVAQPADRGDAPPRFEGRLLVTVSDADMLPSAYADDRLGPAAGADTLSVIRLDDKAGPYRAAEVPVGNSVTGPPASVAATPDGRYAVVIETLGSRPSPATARLSELGRGRSVTLVDLSNPDRPVVVQRVDGYETPLSVAIDPTGTLVAVTHASGSASPPLVFYRIANGTLSAPIVPALPRMDAGRGFIAAAFHPREPVLALIDADRLDLRFLRYADDGKDLRLEAWGNALPIEKGPFLVRFTPDGRHALVNGSHAALEYNLDRNGAPRGSVSSFRVAASVDADGQPQHRFVDRAFTGVIPEGMDVSPDGRLVVTANLERSTPRAGEPDMARFASMTLLRLDPVTGRLKRTDDFAFDGALPETAVFDNASRFVAVTVFSQFDEPRANGSIDFWRIETDPFDPERLELVKTRHSIPVTRGPHSLAVVR